MPFNDDSEQSKVVDELIAILSKNLEHAESRDRLTKIARSEHSGDCALGSVPACTCGKREAEDFLSKDHDHSEVIHGKSRQTDRYPDGCLVNPNFKLGD